MKTVCFTALALIMVMMMPSSCKSAPKGQGDTPVQEVSESEPPPQLEPEPVAEEEIPPEVSEEVSEAPDEEPVPEEPVAEEPFLAEADEADIEEIPPVEDIEPPAVTVVEPEPPVVAAAPEPEPAPPREITRPSPPVSPPPPQVAAPPPPPPAEEEPPAPVREPPPRIVPELPNPTPAIRGLQDEEVVFSRTVRATVGQLVVVPFRGTGWVYLGETGARRGIVYDSRRLDPEGQSFIFRTEAAGEYALKFYRQDFIRDFILNDYVQVIVGPAAETAGTGWFNPSIDRGRVIAEPRWPTSLAEAEALRADTRPARPDPATLPSEQAPSTQTPPAQPPLTQAPPTQPPAAQTPAQTPPPAQPPVQTPPAQTPPTQPPPAQTPTEQAPLTQAPAEPPVPIPPDLAPEAYLEKAKEEFNAGRVAAAISFLDQFCKYFPMGNDEVLWLYGQFYEANSPSRNILTALDCYRRLMQEYPQSSRYDDARRRMAYLQRYYINIQ